MGITLSKTSRTKMNCPKCSEPMKEYQGLKETGWDCVNVDCGKPQPGNAKDEKKSYPLNDYTFDELYFNNKPFFKTIEDFKEKLTKAFDKYLEEYHLVNSASEAELDKLASNCGTESKPALGYEVELECVSHLTDSLRYLLREDDK